MSAIRSARSCQTKCGSMKRSCSCVPQRTRSRSYGAFQKRATSASSSCCCARLICACGGISNARNSTRPSRPVGPSGEYSLSMQISERCVLPVTSISRLRKIRSTSHGGGAPSFAIRHFGEREFEFVQTVVACFVDARRLARRTDEHAGEQVRQRRMVLPIRDQAAQQIGPAQEWTIGRGRAAEHDVIAAAGAGVAAVEHELLGAEPRQPRFFVDRRSSSQPSRPSRATDGC